MQHTQHMQASINGDMAAHAAHALRQALCMQLSAVLPSAAADMAATVSVVQGAVGVDPSCLSLLGTGG